MIDPSKTPKLAKAIVNNCQANLRQLGDKWQRAQAVYDDSISRWIEAGEDENDTTEIDAAFSVLEALKAKTVDALRDVYGFMPDERLNRLIVLIGHGPVSKFDDGAVVDALTVLEGYGRHDKDDTKDDTPKKPIIKRKMNTKASDCARRYREDNGQTPMKTVVEDYVAEQGGSFNSIMRILNDNPGQWKDDTDTT